MKTLTSGVLAAVISMGVASAAEIRVFKQPNFTGEALTLRGTATNLADRGFLDQISSIVVSSGQWQVCTQPDFKGDCAILDRGEYPTLDQRLNHRIESIREVTRTAERDGERRWDRGDRYGAFDGRNRRTGAVELFAAPEFRGRSMRINRDADSLDDGDFDQRAASVVIHEGTWQLCSEPGYEGVCRVFEPGYYETLGRLTRRIGSLRRVG